MMYQRDIGFYVEPSYPTNLLATFSIPKIIADLMSYPNRHFYYSENKRLKIFRCYGGLRRNFYTLVFNLIYCEF